MMTDTIFVAPARDDIDHDVELAEHDDELVELTQVHAPMPATRAAARATQARPPQLAFEFDGTPGDWFGVWFGATLITVLTLGICYPWSLVKTAGWRASHTLVDGQRLRFTGDARELFGRWIGWYALSIVTIGVYSFWAHVRLTRWATEHQELATAG